VSYKRHPIAKTKLLSQDKVKLWRDSCLILSYYHVWYNTLSTQQSLKGINPAIGPQGLQGKMPKIARRIRRCVATHMNRYFASNSHSSEMLPKTINMCGPAVPKYRHHGINRIPPNHSAVNHFSSWYLIPRPPKNRAKVRGDGHPRHMPKTPCDTIAYSRCVFDNDS
jgi:hypothetical protein